MPSALSQQKVAASELRDQTLERFGLGGDGADASIERIVALARRTMNAQFACLSATIDDIPIVLIAHGFEIEQPAVASYASATVMRQMSPMVIRSVDATRMRECPSLRKEHINSFIGAPVRDRDGQFSGALSLYYSYRMGIAPESINALREHVRLIEDVLLMRALSIRDGLTQLFNRRYLDQQLRSEMRRAFRQSSALSVVILDVDKFKLYNDAAGHQAGDRILVRLAAELQRHFRRTGDCVCRYGGEEFALILPATDMHNAVQRVDDCRRRFFELDIRHPGLNDRAVSFSAGIATRSGDSLSEDDMLDELLIEADRALYAAKALGRNTVAHYDEHVQSRSLAG